MEQRIYLLRKKRGLSQQQLAEILHISTSAEGMYEQGRRTPSLQTLIAMATFFHVSLDYLITGTEFSRESKSNIATSTALPSCCRCCFRRCIDS